MTQADRIWWLVFQGLNNASIARRLEISRQRVGEVCSQPAAGQRKRPGRKAEEDYTPPRYRRSMALSEEEEWRVFQILRGRLRWTWWEANKELRNHGLVPKALEINRYLRDSGFRYDRRKQAWVSAGTAEGQEKASSELSA